VSKKFTVKDLEVMHNVLTATLLEMDDYLATAAEKAEIIIPLVKINQLLKGAK
jgi:hypothetical protein